MLNLNVSLLQTFLQEEVANAERAITLMGASLVQTCLGLYLLI